MLCLSMLCLFVRFLYNRTKSEFTAFTVIRKRDDLQPSLYGLKLTIKDTLICNYLRLETQSYISSTISCTSH